jgi:hypothetical protein
MRHPYGLILAITIFFLAGCSTTRVDQFQQFAEAGIRYADSVDTLTAAAGKAAIDTDSMVLKKTRPKEPKERARAILQHNKLMRASLAAGGCKAACHLIEKLLFVTGISGEQ